MAVKSFKANVSGRNFTLTGSGITQSFSRGVATVDPDGSAVASGVMRFDREVLVPTIGSGPTLVQSSSSCAVLASGLDSIGTTSLMLFVDYSGANLYVYRDGTSTSNVTGLTSRTASGDAIAGGAPATLLDLFSTTNAAKALQPVDAVIMHGLIIVAGPVFSRNGSGTYDVAGWGFAISQDAGANWSWWWDDTASVADANIFRGQTWVLTANPVWSDGRTSRPKECWFACTDYRAKTDGDGNLLDPPPTGGRVFVFKATRTIDGSGNASSWTVGMANGNKVKQFDIAAPATHAHTAAITEWQQPVDPETFGLQVIVSVGDNQNHARFVRYTLPDRTVDYTTTGTWVLTDSYHGRKSDDTGAEESPPTGASSKAMQPVGTLFTGTPGAIVWGSDEQMEWITAMYVTLLDVQEQEPSDPPIQAYFEHLYGWASGFGSKDLDDPECRHAATVFNMNQPRPELAASTPAVAIVGDNAKGASPHLNRILYTAGIDLSGTADTWCQVGVVRGGGIRLTAVLYGPSNAPWTKIYYVSPISDDAGAAGLRVIDVPTLKALRPALVAGGGKNKVVTDASDTFHSEVQANSVATITTITRASESVAFQDGGLTLPKPPSMSKVMLKIETDRDPPPGPPPPPPPPPPVTQKIYLGPSSTSNWSGSPDAPCDDWATGPIAQVRRFRAWVLDGSYLAKLPNKTVQFSGKTNDGTTELPGVPVLYSCQNKWAPVTIILNRIIASGRALSMAIYPSYGGGNGPDDNLYYLIVDQTLDGNGSFAFPLAAVVKGSTAADVLPETLTIGGLGLAGSSHWLLRLSLMMPVGNWDQYADRIDANGDSDKHWPLFHMSDGGSKSIEFVADCEDRRFLLRLNDGTTTTEVALADAPNSGKQIWLPDSPLHVALAFNKTASQEKLHCGASLGGDLTRAISGGSAAAWIASTTFTELRFKGTSGEVHEMRILGGEIDDARATAPTETTVKEAFSSLGYL